MYDISMVVRDLAGAFLRGDVAVLCGAGISRNSGLPVVAEFLTEIFQLTHITSLEVRDVLEHLPFEAVMHEFAWGGDIRTQDVEHNQLPANAYQVFRGTTSGDLSPGAKVVNATTYTDNSVKPQTTYYYEIVASDTGGDQSPPSNQVSATTP
jgi:hypothetical protein